MLMAPLLAASIVALASLNHAEPIVPRERLRTLERQTTDCVAHVVRMQTRYAPVASADVNDLIVNSIPFCRSLAQKLIDAYDDRYGMGEGEKYFLGPYLDKLPKDVREKLNELAGP